MSMNVITSKSWVFDNNVWLITSSDFENFHMCNISENVSFPRWNHDFKKSKKFLLKEIDSLYFLIPMYGREYIVLGPNFWNEDFDGFTLFEVP